MTILERIEGASLQGIIVKIEINISIIPYVLLNNVLLSSVLILKMASHLACLKLPEAVNPLEMFFPGVLR